MNQVEPFSRNLTYDYYKWFLHISVSTKTLVDYKRPRVNFWKKMNLLKGDLACGPLSPAGCGENSVCEGDGQTAMCTCPEVIQDLFLVK